MILCSCGCGKEVGNRKGKKFATSACRYRSRNRLLRIRAKKTVELARELKAEAKKALAMAEEILGPEF